MKNIEALFAAVREAADSRSWSRGVELARTNAVNGESDAGEEITLRVSTRGGMICPRVTLFVDDEDWDCECNRPADPCEHVTAAIIALRQARKQGKALPRSSEGGALGAGEIHYQLARTENGRLALTRQVVRGEKCDKIKSTLHAISSGRIDGPKFLATPADLAVERALGPQVAGGALSPGVLRNLFPHLQRCEKIFLDGQPVSISRDPMGPRAILEDRGEGFLLRIEEDPSIVERFSGGVVLCEQTLCFTSRGQLTGRELAELPRGRYFSPDQALTLVSEVLPDLEGRIPVEIRTRRLPDTTRIRPRVEIEVDREGDNLSVLPLLFYGQPPIARIDAGRLVPLGNGALPLRDEPAEDRLRIDLREQLGLIPGRRTVFPPEEALRFTKRLEAWRSGSVAGTAHREFFQTPPLQAHIESTGDDLRIRFESATKSPHQASAEKVLRSWRTGESLVPLEAGGFAPLPSDWLERYGDALADLLEAKKAAGGRLPASALADAARFCDALELPRPRGADTLLALAEQFHGIPESPLPDDLRAELRPYQRQGLDWLAFLRELELGALLADDMGLGKTIQALCALRGRSLVVAPTSVLHGWADEIRRFRPEQSICIYHGPARQLDPQAAITLTTYAILRLDIDQFEAQSWDIAILDEAQAIKNPESQAARAAYRLPARFRISLTGTPIENHLDELWSQFHFINPGFLGTRSDFEARYGRPIARGDEEVAARLRQRIRPFLLRRLKRDVAPELPPRTETVLYCALEEEERRLYDALRAATRKEVVERLRGGGNVFEALELLLRLRQAACHAALLPGQEDALEGGPSAKLQVLLEKLAILIEDGHKALVFSQWTRLLDLVEPHLAAAEIPFTRLDGSTRDRGAVVRNFQDPEGPPILLISLKAGGTGLNLTAADHVFLLDPWWNPAVEDQAADRTHRIGQDKPVMIYRLVAEQTVEEAILALQERKRSIRDAALGEGMEAAASLTRDDLLGLLE